jgi:hypothetical protein
MGGVVMETLPTAQNHAPCLNGDTGSCCRTLWLPLYVASMLLSRTQLWQHDTPAGNLARLQVWTEDGTHMMSGKKTVSGWLAERQQLMAEWGEYAMSGLALAP